MKYNIAVGVVDENVVNRKSKRVSIQKFFHLAPYSCEW